MLKSLYIDIRNHLRELIAGTEFDGKVFFVGGCCRDDIMGTEIKDIDISVALPDGGIRLAMWLHQNGHTAAEVSAFPEFHTAKFRLADFPDVELESVHTRKETYPDRGSRNPVTGYGTHEEDCFRRDFTVNALYQNVSTGEIMDITGKGLDDIRDRIIRTPSDPFVKFDEDPLRILRCVRFAARFGWMIERETYEAMKSMVPRMSILTKARMNEEFFKMMQDERPAMAVRLLCEIGAVGHVLPEVPSEGDVESLERMASMTSSPFMRLAALLYRSNDLFPEIQRMVLLCREVETLTDLADACIREIQFKCADLTAFGNLILLAAAVGMDAQKCGYISKRTEQMVAEGSAMFGYKPVLSGKDIMQIKSIGPGPQIKKCQDYLMALAFNDPKMPREQVVKHLEEYQL